LTASNLTYSLRVLLLHTGRLYINSSNCPCVRITDGFTCGSGSASEMTYFVSSGALNSTHLWFGSSNAMRLWLREVRDWLM